MSRKETDNDKWVIHTLTDFMKAEICYRRLGRDLSLKIAYSIQMIFCASIFFAVLVAPDTAEAWPSKYASCTGCHSAVDGDANIYVAIDGTETASVNVEAGDSFEIDYYFTNAAEAGSYTVGVQVVFPDGWSIASGTNNSPTITGGWDTAWDVAAGVGWSSAIETDGEYAGTDGVTIDFDGSSWYNGNKTAACDNGGSCSSGTDLDGTSETMGADGIITVDPTEEAGVYTVYLFGVGHDGGGTKSHVVQSITVTVNDPPGLNARSPGTLASDSSNGGGMAWGSVGNAGSQDDSYATLTEITSQTSHYLKATNFGMIVPGTATIDGIKVEIDGYASASNRISDSEVKIVKGGVVGTQNKAAGGYWATSDTNTYRTYGGASILWGETWSAADINNANFGVVLSVSSSGGENFFYIDHIRITVYYTDTGTAPDDPTSLTQYRTDGTTQITQGNITNESSIIIKAYVDDSDNDNVSIQGEIVLNAGSFTGAANCTGGSPIAVPGTAQVTCTGLSDSNDYKWRVRAYDGTNYSNWVSYGGSPDVSVSTSSPDIPSDHAQYKSDASTPITQGTYTDEATVVIKATVSDPDLDDTRLEVEIADVDAAFTGTATCNSGYVTSGTVATATCSGLVSGVYKWQARTSDGTNTSSWAGY